MANHDVSPNINQGVVDRRRAVPGANAAGNFSADTDFNSIATMRARLTAINAGNYTAAKLDAMTKNDMAYAIRLNDELASI